MEDAARAAFRELPRPMQRALELGWESACAGSIGIGAVVVAGDGTEVATGRNRLLEDVPGDDVIAGSSLAHAELNALAKLGYRQHEDDDLELHTTLQPCVQCLAAIRLSPVRRVRVLAPDPLWAGTERMHELTPYLAARWPGIEMLPVGEWTVFALVFPTAHVAGRISVGGLWATTLPETTALAERVHDALGATMDAGESVVAAAGELWSDLTRCVDEVERSASRLDWPTASPSR
ncbi:MAG: nucleoside deaminase [Ilumatobacter sp.]|uniref:nucleoside deaminase n=1 Tax=Ilumatobacter sp. TaxID=1967498 RepID=UPI0026191BED|nr:nucleoside deaminase [Ilumatobacter sp.]MDJ0771338.1 nucleoside deaminase [Ilumatobacter sp.]